MLMTAIQAEVLNTQAASLSKNKQNMFVEKRLLNKTRSKSDQVALK